MTEPVDLLTRIDELELELRESEAALQRHRVRSPKNGCGSPDHDAAPDKIRALEAELAKFTKPSRARRDSYLERIGRERHGRLIVEIERLKVAISKAQPLATGDRGFLEALKAAREHKGLLETRHASLDLAGRELVEIRDRDRAVPPVVWVPDPADRTMDRQQVIKIAIGALAVMSALGASAAIYTSLVAVMFVVRIALFPGCRAKEMVSRDGVYGESWRDVSLISSDPDRLVLQIRGDTHIFDAKMPAFREVVQMGSAAGVIASSSSPPDGERDPEDD